MQLSSPQSVQIFCRMILLCLYQKSFFIENAITWYRYGHPTCLDDQRTVSKCKNRSTLVSLTTTISYYLPILKILRTINIWNGDIGDKVSNSKIVFYLRNHNFPRQWMLSTSTSCLLTVYGFTLTFKHF